MVVVDETRQELAERMAQEVDCSVARALVAVDNLIDRGLIELAHPWQLLATAPQVDGQDILIKVTFSDGFSYQDVGRWIETYGENCRGFFQGGKGNYRPQDWHGKDRNDLFWRPLRNS